MKINRNLTIALTIISLTGCIGMSSKVASAATDSSNETVINERWGKPTFVVGAGLNQDQTNETMKLLEIESNAVNTQKATGKDLITYLGYGSGDDSVMLSSVVVNREDEGKGINVDILTPQNITLITADQYKNPLVTAGIKDATIKVASVVKVTGESALTGVYKAFQANGEAVDPDRAKLAQEELDTTTDLSKSIVEQATEDNKSESLTEDEQAKADEAYKAQLNQTLVDIKKELADLKEKQGELATKAEVEKIVNEALTKNNLSTYLSKEDITKLVALAEKYQSTAGVLDKESIKQLDKISAGFTDTVSRLGDELGKFGESLKGTIDENQGFFSNLWTSITDFFGDIFN
ncbi:inosine-5-monophosphate dehydrogenase [Enterococcus sp. JM4C]|uniref:DUF1002 domain-containing protein n=1 Tax=Candidatus Enterococcus huntleyi TaxID=1857217 RepID=UPI001379BFE0|nr:DUF1002 domain-containing protein [Enterococcus sp. JM4C]KAF1296484.1 inosine-5-monophosphate dehydrogenase [Enterococcus sp. JM4C]